MTTIKEGISTHSFSAEIWFNINPKTGEIKSIEWANPYNFLISITIGLDNNKPECTRNTKGKGKIFIPKGYFLSQTEEGFDAPDPKKFMYQFAAKVK